MRLFFCILALCPLLTRAAGTNLQITAFNPAGQISWTNAYPVGVCTVESASQLTGTNWTCQQNFYTTNSAGQGVFTPPGSNQFFRLLAANLSTNTPLAFSNLVYAYGTLHTIAGNGDAGYPYPGQDVTNYWQPSFEGQYATNVALSRPHFAMEDNAGNIYIVDKDSDSVLKVTPDGRLHTIAGTHIIGDSPDTAMPGTSVNMSTPNGLWVRGDGTVYVMDTGNGKIRRLDTNGMMTTLFTDPNGISGGRGLWVRSDENLVYYASGKDLRQWTPGAGTKNLNKGFNDLGNIIISGTNIIATDRGGNNVWIVNTNSGASTLLFGNGNENLVVDNSRALTNSLYGVRGVWQPPSGGYFLADDYSAQFVYVDTAGILHLFVNGQQNSHAGDGKFFYAPNNLLIGQMRSVTMDNQGNLILVENDLGYVRRIDFHRLTP